MANHNSHLDTLVLMTLLPRSLLGVARPVAAADYFLRNPLIAWFSTRVIGILPLRRKATAGESLDDRLGGLYEALERGEVLVLFPEGTRGEPEKLAPFKSGIAHLAARFPHVPVLPVFLHGLGKALPRGEAMLVPFFCDVFVGEPLHGTDDKTAFLSRLESALSALAAEGRFAPWE